MLLCDLMVFSDITPPVLENCPDSFTVYTEIDQRAYVIYIPPTAVDNLGNSVEVSMTLGMFKILKFIILDSIITRVTLCR